MVVATPQGIPDQSLLEQLNEYFRDRREIAVDVCVLAPEPVAVDVQVQIESTDMEQATLQIKQALTEWFSGQRLGQDVLRAKLGSLIFALDGVDNYTLSVPAADMSVGKAQLPVLGTVTVEAMT